MFKFHIWVYLRLLFYLFVVCVRSIGVGFVIFPFDVRRKFLFNDFLEFLQFFDLFFVTFDPVFEHGLHALQLQGRRAGGQLDVLGNIPEEIIKIA